MVFRRDHLHYFVTVVEEGQITRAAARLHIAQPALSQAIAQLEQDLGLELLVRHARGVTLTRDGEKVYEKARESVAVTMDAVHTARALGRAQEGSIAFGFVGVPPGLDSPALVDAFSVANPQIELRYQELPFPSAPTSRWLAEVDVAVCHQPLSDPGVWARTLRSEPRVVLASGRHPIAGHDELTVADVIDETFIRLHPSVEPRWAGFWSLDDQRGGPPRRMTRDAAANAQEVLAALTVRNAITIVPAAVAGLIPGMLKGVVAVPLADAEPSLIQLVGHADGRNALVRPLVSFAETLAASSAGRPASSPLAEVDRGGLV